MRSLREIRMVSIGTLEGSLQGTLIPLQFSKFLRQNINTKRNMKRYLLIASATLSAAVFGMLMTSCGNIESTGTHMMGPPGKERAMGDSAMPSKAR